MRDYILIAIIAYLCGSIPFGYLLVRVFKGKDIRESGSGNIGATNVARTAPGLGLATLLLDMLKGLLPVLLVPLLLKHDSLWGAPSHPFLDSLSGDRWTEMAIPAYQALAALCAVVGHIFPMWLKFRGGKGVATAVGALILLSPNSLGIALLIFIFFLSLTRYVSLSSIAGAISFPITLAILHRQYGFEVISLVCLVSILIVGKHHANIRRLLNGTENRFGKKRAQEQIVAED